MKLASAKWRKNTGHVIPILQIFSSLTDCVSEKAELSERREIRFPEQKDAEVDRDYPWVEYGERDRGEWLQLGWLWLKYGKKLDSRVKWFDQLALHPNDVIFWNA